MTCRYVYLTAGQATGDAQPHQRQGQVRQTHLRRLHLRHDEGDAGGEEGGKPYPAWYRNICSMGAQWHGIEDEFKVRNTSGWSLVFPASAPTYACPRYRRQ